MSAEIASDVEAPLSPTPRTTVGRGAKRAQTDRERLYEILGEAVICHLGVVPPGADHPVVLPTAFGWDPDGPDRAGTVYLHGSVAARSILAAPTTTICVTFTLLDGLVAARSGFHHSMNYRSAVVIGPGRLVTDAAEKTRALDLVVDHMVPGRAATLRAPSRKELAATSVVALALHEASVKIRDGGPVDEPEDVAAGVWGGVIPVRQITGEPETDPLVDAPVPTDVRARADRRPG